MFAPERRSYVEYLVFALSAILVAVLGYQVVRRGLPGWLARGGSAVQQPQYRDLDASSAAAPAPAPDAVGFVAPVKVSGKAGKPGDRTISVPEPSR